MTISRRSCSGVNAVLRSLKFNKGDALLINTFTYTAVQDACRYIADRHGKKSDEFIVWWGWWFVVV